MNKFIVPEFDKGDDKKYKVEAIRNSAVYIKKADRHLLRLYYLVPWKDYLEEESTWEPSSIVMHFRKMVNIISKDHPKKPIVISVPIDSALPMAKPTI